MLFQTIVFKTSMENYLMKMPNKIVSVFFILLFFVFQAEAQKRCDAPNDTAALPCAKNVLKLGKNEFEVRVYTKAYKNRRVSDRTFAVVHHNEQKGLTAAKKVISEDGGRLVEVVSKDARDLPRRYLHVDFGENTNVCVDPNRIYSKLGIRKFFAGYPRAEDNLEDVCTPVSADMVDSDTDTIINEIERFGRELLKIVTNNNRHRFIIGVHNNVDLKLDVASWLAPGGEAKTAVGVFQANTASHDATADKDDFILVTNTNLFVKVLNLKEYYNIALQEDKNFLDKNRATTDDGSMSIYFGTRFWGKTKQVYDYINIEAQGKDDEEDEFKARQARAIRLINNLKF
jgi:hypothetical protein